MKREPVPSFLSLKEKELCLLCSRKGLYWEGQPGEGRGNGLREL